MLEVLVAMMVVFLTFMTSLNGLLYAAMFQVKADRQAQAVYWIQQDVEKIKSIAASAPTTSPFAPSYASACTGTSAASNSCCATTVSSGNVTGGFANALRTSSSLPPLTSQTFFGKDYVMLRGFPAISPTSPQILKITYTVREASDSTKVLATLYTEVLPAASLSCK